MTCMAEAGKKKESFDKEVLSMKKKELKSKMNEVIKNAPLPYYCCEKSGRELFEEVKKEYPEASFHERTGFMPAICLDDLSRIVLSLQLIAISKYCLYYSAVGAIDSNEVMIESNLIRKGLDLEPYREEVDE